MYCTTEYINKLIKSSKKMFITLNEFIVFVCKRAKNDMILRVASSLSYTSLLAIVPLFLIMISVFSVFPVFENLKDPMQEFLAENLVPTAEQQFMLYFSELNLVAGKFTTVGIIGLAIISILMLSTIENSLNFIFKVTRPRRFTTKITLYWTVITLGPLLLGTAFSMRGYFYTLQKFVPNNIVDSQLILLLLPSVITFVLLILVYVLVPNKKVKINHASLGAFIAVILFSILRKASTFFIFKSATYQILYGALALIPIFLVWMYLAWTVVILGAVITAALDEFRSLSKIQLKKFLIAGKPEKRK